MPSELEDFLNQTVGLTTSNVRRGAGTAILLDLIGPNIMSAWVMIEWSWRVEENSQILLGSFNDDSEINSIVNLIEPSEVAAIQLFGEIPELVISFSSGLRLLSSSTVNGDPQWALHVNGTTLSFQSGRYVYETTPN